MLQIYNLYLLLSIFGYKHRCINQLSIKTIYWDRKITLLFNMKIRKITTFLSTNALQTRSEILLLLLQVHHSHASSHNQIISLGKGKGFHKEKGLERECWCQISERDAKLGLEGKGILEEFICYHAWWCKWDPKTYFYMIKYVYLVWGWDTMGKMVGNPLIACKLCRIPCNYIFFPTFGGKCRLSSMQLAYVRGMTSMKLECVCGQ